MDRDVFYIPGFDPRSYKFYYSMFKHNVYKTSGVDNDKISITKLNDQDIPNFEINYKNFCTKYSFFDWSDIVIKHFYKRFFAVFIAFFMFLKNYIFKGIHLKLIKHATTQTITGGYYVLLFFIITYLILAFILCALNGVIQNPILYTFCCLVIAYFGTKFIYFLANKTGVFWLLSIYNFCYDYAVKKPQELDEKITNFANVITANLKENQGKNHETIIIAHSVGGIIAVSLVSRIINLCKAQNISTDNLKLILLGACMPLSSLHTNIITFKKELEILANSNITCLNLTSKIDGASFYKLDYIKLADIKAKSPKFISVRFFKIYTQKTYKKLRYNWYEVHFLYLKATEIRGGYDYFYLVADPKNLESKLN
ncbi:hypothetical protein [Campylobacter gastrosuis]|uniref:DUF829 domain-containing protein n=1 Tax=Campylobacter gastrosuis TaxID=2974576 RepID=A0ABT7HSP8_9BACT|nr:hypothetical protein [Campylobacter gastrosuis]MDL0089937.1 hypothetical protein [Campylobacter gastrosuis]